MAEHAIVAEPRSANGKSASRALRAAGRIPAVLYGAGMAPVSLSVNGKELVRLLGQGAEGQLVTLRMGDSNVAVIVRDVRREPIKGTLLHVDFHKVAMDKKLHTTVPVLIVGEGARESDGGVVVHGARELTVECLPGQIPEHIEVDISGLALGDTVRAADVQLPAGVTLVSDSDSIVVSIAAPTKAVAEAPAETPAEPEQVVEKGEE